jgi:hypothetical protein
LGPNLVISSKSIGVWNALFIVHQRWFSFVYLAMPGFALANEVLFFREKDPKPLTPSQASSDGTDATLRKADQLASLKQGLPNDQSVRPLGLSAGVG